MKNKKVRHFTTKTYLRKSWETSMRTLILIDTPINILFIGVLGFWGFGVLSPLSLLSPLSPLSRKTQKVDHPGGAERPPQTPPAFPGGATAPPRTPP